MLLVPEGGLEPPRPKAEVSSLAQAQPTGKEPDRRFASVSAFSEDIGRFLDHLDQQRWSREELPAESVRATAARNRVREVGVLAAPPLQSVTG